MDPGNRVGIARRVGLEELELAVMADDETLLAERQAYLDRALRRQGRCVSVGWRQ
jgi:hypothetical protein